MAPITAPMNSSVVFFFNDTATTEIYTLSLHDALPILPFEAARPLPVPPTLLAIELLEVLGRSEEHTSELQSRLHLVCRLLLEKKKRHARIRSHIATPPADRPVNGATQERVDTNQRTRL